MVRQIEIEGRRCSFCGSAGGPVLLWIVGEEEPDALAAVYARIGQLTGASPFILAAIPVKNWNDDLSPWNAPPVFGSEGFGGGAGETLAFVTQRALPFWREFCGGETRFYLGGYSLAGLFALWAAHERADFDGVAAVSPSVWFPQWTEYAAVRPILAQRVYLSLGNREARTRNPVMAQVAKKLERQYEILQKNPAVSDQLLEWNAGNHFYQPQERMAKGFAWLLSGTDPEKRRGEERD